MFGFMKRQNMVELTHDFNQKQGLISLSQPQVLAEQSPKPWKIIILSAVNAISLIFSILLYVFSRKSSVNMNECLKNISAYCKLNFIVYPFKADLIILAPILDEVQIPMFTSKINGTFFTPEHPSIARQDPSSEVDELWKDLEILRTVVVTKDDIIKMGKDPETVAKFDNDYWGFGDDAYMAEMDVFHQIHCLNMLRRKAFGDFPTHRIPDTPEKYLKLQWTHLGHCTDILYQNILCHADTELYTLHWMDTQNLPYPDFNINRQCKDMNPLINWRNERMVDLKKFGAMKRPAGAHVLPLPEQYYELYEQDLKSKGIIHHHHD